MSCFFFFHSARSKRHRSRTWDPTPLPPKKRTRTPRTLTPRGHTPRSEIVTPRSRGHHRSNTTGADLARPRQEREDFRKAIVNLIMWVEWLYTLVVIISSRKKCALLYKPCTGALAVEYRTLGSASTGVTDIWGQLDSFHRQVYFSF